MLAEELPGVGLSQKYSQLTTLVDALSSHKEGEYPLETNLWAQLRVAIVRPRSPEKLDFLCRQTLYLHILSREVTRLPLRSEVLEDALASFTHVCLNETCAGVIVSHHKELIPSLINYVIRPYVERDQAGNIPPMALADLALTSLTSLALHHESEVDIYSELTRGGTIIQLCVRLLPLLGRITQGSAYERLDDEGTAQPRPPPQRRQQQQQQEEDNFLVPDLGFTAASMLIRLLSYHITHEVDPVVLAQLAVPRMLHLLKLVLHEGEGGVVLGYTRDPGNIIFDLHLLVQAAWLPVQCEPRLVVLLRRALELRAAGNVRMARLAILTLLACYEHSTAHGAVTERGFVTWLQARDASWEKWKGLVDTLAASTTCTDLASFQMYGVVGRLLAAHGSVQVEKDILGRTRPRGRRMTLGWWVVALVLAMGVQWWWWVYKAAQ